MPTNARSENEISLVSQLLQPRFPQIACEMNSSTVSMFGLPQELGKRRDGDQPSGTLSEFSVPLLPECLTHATDMLVTFYITQESIPRIPVIHNGQDLNRK